MNEALLQQLETKIKQIIARYSELKSFYIGKTENIDSRREKHREEGYPYTFHIAVGPADRIAVAEEVLQKIFLENPKCSNERVGGGNPDANNLYLAIDTDIPLIEDLCDDAIVEPIVI